MPQGIDIKYSVDLTTTLFDPEVDAVVGLTFTCLKYKDSYISSLKEYIESDKFKELEESKTFSVKSVQKWFNEHRWSDAGLKWFNERSESDTGFSVKSVTKWFNDNSVSMNIRENLSQFRWFAEANKYEKRIHFSISAISNPNIAGSSIYLYEKGKLTEKQFKSVSNPATPTNSEKCMGPSCVP